MQLAIISTDLFQTNAVAGAARRLGWTVVRAASMDVCRQLGHRADAIVVDAECVDREFAAELTRFAAEVGPERVFVLAERIAGVLPTPEGLGVHALQLKPFHPGDFLRLVQASIPTARNNVRRVPCTQRSIRRLGHAAWIR